MRKNGVVFMKSKKVMKKIYKKWGVVLKKNIYLPMKI